MVATPIGNLKDISQRAVETLKSVAVVASEDTRRTALLLKHFGISNRQLSYHEHNEERAAHQLLSILLGAKDVALVTNAGTPLISDPGFRIVRLCIENEIPIVSIPGASAILAGLVISGLPVNKFCFEGFLPRSAGRLRRQLEELVGERRTMVFFESGHRIKKTLAAMEEVFGQRLAYIGRELTKKFEQSYRGTIGDLRKIIESESPKGEFVLIVEGIKPGCGEKYQV